MTDLGTHRESLQRLGQMAKDVERTLDQAAGLTRSSIDALRTIDDPDAREAVDLAIRAHDDIFNVIYGWLNNYLRGLPELTRRIDR